jgi:hypothetical protein
MGSEALERLNALVNEPDGARLGPNYDGLTGANEKENREGRGGHTYK